MVILKSRLLLLVVYKRSRLLARLFKKSSMALHERVVMVHTVNLQHLMALHHMVEALLLMFRFLKLMVG